MQDAPRAPAMQPLAKVDSFCESMPTSQNLPIASRLSPPFFSFSRLSPFLYSPLCIFYNIWVSLLAWLFDNLGTMGLTAAATVHNSLILGLLLGLFGHAYASPVLHLAAHSLVRGGVVSPSKGELLHNTIRFEVPTVVLYIYWECGSSTSPRPLPLITFSLTDRIWINMWAYRINRICVLRNVHLEDFVMMATVVSSR